MPLRRSLGRPWRHLGRKSAIAVAVVLVAVAATGVWLVTRPGDAAAAQTITATVSSGTYQQTVSATGTLAPLREGDLSFGVSGRVTKVFVGAGDAVHKGDVLATLDATSLRAALDSASAQLDASQAQYTDDADADASSTQLAADSASVASAKSGLSQAQDDLDSATLRSTMTGTVASVDVAVGDQVSGTSSSSSSASSGGASTGGTSPANGASDSSSSSSSSSGSTDAAFVVVSPHRFKVVADVAAADVASVRKGMQAQITPTGATQPVYGTVTAVGLVAEAS
jgi:multidrug efflux pump subunit AcrA (membrane-fusion protein)